MKIDLGRLIRTCPGGREEHRVCHPPPSVLEVIEDPIYLTEPELVSKNEVLRIPREAALGGAETMYPEFRQRIKGTFVRPEKCTQNCGAPNPPLAAPPAPAGAR